MALLKTLSPTEAIELIYDWSFWARPEQQLAPDGDWWTTWVYKAGRGAGKTRSGAEYIREGQASGECGRIALISKTPAAARDEMIEGESGLLAISPPDNRPKYEPSKRRLTWPNGAIATVYSSHEPDALRGPQHDRAWGDELASWAYPQETWDNLLFGLRLGLRPTCVITTTPKPIKLLRDILAEPTTALTEGSSYDNRANLTPIWFDRVIARYEGTRTGRQEIWADLLDEAEGALWKRVWIDEHRTHGVPRNEAGDALGFRRIVVAIDPAVTANESSDETGIIVAALGENSHGYVLEDASGRYSPQDWAQKAINLYRDWRADRIIGEVNNGGDMIETTLRAVHGSVPYTSVYASRGKRTRAEPIAALYQQGRIHHVGGEFDQLEDQLATWEANSGDKSPDRLDALVWALSELMLGGTPSVRFM